MPPHPTEGTTNSSGTGALGPLSIKTLLAVFILTVVVLGYFSTALSGHMLLTERDLSVFFIPPRILWVDTLLSGEFPLWNPYSFSGTPLLATLQPGVLYPVNLLLLLLPFDLAFNWSIILHFIIAGICAFLLMRDRGVSATGSIAGALCFMLSGYLFSVHNVISTLFTVAWLPLVLLLFMRALFRVSYVYSILTGVVLAVMFTGGGIEVLFGTLVLLLVISLFPSVMRLTEEGGPLPRPGITQRVRLLLAAVVVMALLSAVELLPFMELARLSTRASGLSYAEATTWSFSLRDFLHLFIPDPYGYGANNEKYWSNQSWLKTVYIGFIPFVLAYFHLRAARARALPFILAGVLFIVLAMGANTPFYHLFFDHLPFFNKMRYPVKFLFVPFLFISLAAGAGADRLREIASMDRMARPVRIAYAAIAISTVAAVAFGLLSFQTTNIIAWLVERGYDYPEYNYAAINLFNSKRVIFFLVVTSFAVFLGLRASRGARLVPYAVIILLGLDLFFAHRGYYAATPAADYHTPGEVIRHVKSDTSGLFRVFSTPRTMREGIEVRSTDGVFDEELLKSMSLDKERVTGYNLEHRVFDLHGYGVIQRGDYAAVYTMLAAQPAIDSTNLLSLMNVRYVISIPVIDSPEFRLVKAIGAADAEVAEDATDGLLKIYEYENFLPRFYTVDDYRLITRPEEYVETLTSKAFSPAKVVLLERDPWPEIDETAGGGAPTEEIPAGERVPVEVVEYRSNSVILRAGCGANPCILVASESFYPGWKALVDGTETEILRADYIYRAVPLGPGTHEVRFNYRPASFVAGAVVSTATALCLLALAFVGIRRRRIH